MYIDVIKKYKAKPEIFKGEKKSEYLSVLFSSGMCCFSFLQRN